MANSSRPSHRSSTRRPVKIIVVGSFDDYHDKDHRHGSATSRLLNRFATVEEVANMIVYVCRPLASATNGAALRVDGGVVQAIV